MIEAIYKVGDIIEFTEVIPRQLGLLAGPVRGLIIKISDLEYIISYRLLLYGNPGCAKNMTIGCAFEKDIVPAAKKISHIDISALMFLENEEPDYAMFFTVATIAQAADLRNELDKIKKENERLSNENRELKAMNDELRKSIPEYNKLALKHFACTEKIKKLEAENEPLKRENEELRAGNKKLAEANARYLQSMTCAKKQMTEAAKRICEAEEHIDVAVCNS